MWKSLIDRFESLWSENRAFVFFRLPNSNKAILYVQDDLTICKSTDFSSPGFVLAPFDYQTEHYFIPRDQFEEFQIDFNRANHRIKTSKNLSIDKKHFLELVNKAKNFISKKKAKKIVVSTYGELNMQYPPSSWFVDLFNKNPTTFVSFFHHPKIGTWFGASPELLLEKTGNSYKTIALAGTKLISSKKKILWTEKEKKEQRFVQDQIQSDLTKLTPKIILKKSKTSNYTTGHLKHLITRFHFKSDLHPRLIIKKLHPTAAIAGIPKKNVLEFIRQYESYDRTYYSGFLGPTANDNFLLYVNLRCAQLVQKTARIYIGAGITIESEPKKELDEILQKAQTLMDVLK